MALLGVKAFLNSCLYSRGKLKIRENPENYSISIWRLVVFGAQRSYTNFVFSLQFGCFEIIVESLKFLRIVQSLTFSVILLISIRKVWPIKSVVFSYEFHFGLMLCIVKAPQNNSMTNNCTPRKWAKLNWKSSIVGTNNNKLLKCREATMPWSRDHGIYIYNIIIIAVVIIIRAICVRSIEVLCVWIINSTNLVRWHMMHQTKQLICISHSTFPFLSFFMSLLLLLPFFLLSGWKFKRNRTAWMTNFHRHNNDKMTENVRGTKRTNKHNKQTNNQTKMTSTWPKCWLYTNTIAMIEPVTGV